MVGSGDQRRQAPLAGVGPAGWKVWTPNATEGREGRERGRKGKEGSRREEREKRKEGGEERGRNPDGEKEGRERNGMVVERVNPVGRRASQAKQSKVQAKAKKAPEKQTQSKKNSSSTEGAGWPGLDWLMARGGSALGVPYRAEPSRVSSPVSLALFILFSLCVLF